MLKIIKNNYLNLIKTKNKYNIINLLLLQI